MKEDSWLLGLKLVPGEEGRLGGGGGRVGDMAQPVLHCGGSIMAGPGRWVGAGDGDGRGRDPAA
jgi:hypothetical protein